MRAEDHWEKARRLENSRLDKLDPNGDAELSIWSCIHGGAQLLNVVLHCAGATGENFDMIHTNVPDPTYAVPESLQPIFAALSRIEALGPRFVRGAEPWSSEVARQCLADYALVKAAAAAALSGSSAAGRAS